MAESWKNLEKWERLRWARTEWAKTLPKGARSDNGSAAHAARLLNMEPGTYRTYERDPDQPDGRDWDDTFAQPAGKLFNVSWIWLLQGGMAPTYQAALGVRPDMELIARELDAVPSEKREDAAAAAIGVIRALFGSKG